MRTPRDGEAYSHTTGERLSYEDQARRLLLLASLDRGWWRRRRLLREAEVFALLSYATTERHEPTPREYTVPDMTAPAESLFDALVKFARNEKVFEQVTIRLYDRILGPVGHPEMGDGTLAPYFAGIDRPRLERHMTAFLITATGGPRVYSGRAMGVAHGKLRITEAAWDRVIWHVVVTLREFGVPEHHIDSVGEAVAPLKGAIVTA